MQLVLVVLGLATVTVAMVAWNRDAPPLPARETTPPAGALSDEAER